LIIMELRDLIERWRESGDFGSSWRRNLLSIVFVSFVLIAVLALATSFYRVDASDEGVVLRFGKHVRTAPPGLHMKAPWPIERVYDVSVQRIQTLEFGFETERAGRFTEYAPTGPEHLNVAEMLTGDLNLAYVEWVVQYRVKDAAAYLFHIGDVEGIRPESLPAGVRYDPNAAVPDTIRDVSESVLRKLVGDTSVDAILTIGREGIASNAKLEIQQMLDDFNAGVQIVTVKLQNTSPPEEVKDAFQEVNRARHNKDRVVREAEGERNRQIPAARGKRDKAISEAEGYRERIVLETKGKIAAFLAQLAEYEKAPEVTRKRLYLEAMEEVLAGVDQKTILDESLQGLLPLLNLDQGTSRPAAGEGGVR
jgi:membrane protease subunit HflK